MSGHTATPFAPDATRPRITLEGNCIVDDGRRMTIAKFDLYNGSREELQAVIDRANALSAPNSHADLVRALEEMIAEFGSTRPQPNCDCPGCNVVSRARAALATLTARKVG